MGVAIAHGDGGKVHFRYGVARAVNAHIKAEGEDVLMDMGLNAGGNADSVFGRSIVPCSGAVGNAGCLHFNADAAILVEIPEEAIDIVADVGDCRDDKTA